MNRFDFNELIEKAFSMGYECALEELEEQREFGNKENKRKRREWERQQGINARYDGNKLSFDDGRIIGKRHAESGHEMEYDARNIAAARALRYKENREDRDWDSLNGAINARGTAEKNSFYKNPHKQRYVGKNKEDRSDDYIKAINKQRIENRKNKIEESKIASKIDEIEKKDNGTKKNLKRAGAILGGATLIGAAAYGIKKHQDKKRAEKEERRRLEEENKALREALGMKEGLKNK